MEQINPDMEKKITMADRFLIAMFSPKEYQSLFREKTGKVVQFLILLMLMVTMIRYVIPTLAFVAGMGGMKNIIMQEIPDFSLQNGQFALDERIEKEDEVNGIYVLCDTEIDKFTKEDIPQGVVEAVLISKTNMLIYNELTGMTGAVQDTAFSDFKEITINNKTLADMSGVIYFVMGIFYITLFFVELVKYMMVGLFYSMFMLMYASAFNIPHPFQKIYKTSMYAQATGTIVYAVTCCIGSSMLMFAGSIFEVLISISIMRKVLFPIRKIPTSL